MTELFENPRFKRLLVLILVLQSFGLWNILNVQVLLFVGALGLYLLSVNGMSTRFTSTLLTLLGGLVFVLAYPLSLTVELAAAFLFLSVSTKALEIRQDKDLYVFVFSQCYLSCASFLFEQAIMQVVLSVVVLFVLLQMLMLLHSSGKWRFGSNFRALFKATLVAVPIAVVCFLFFPRLAPLWSIPIDARTGTTGISAQMSPGDIASLSQSNERAFRVEFFGTQPPAQQDRYWRGLVLDHFDGRIWKRSSEQKLLTAKQRTRYEMAAMSVPEGAYYDVLIDPHNQRWTFSLSGGSSMSKHLKHADMGLYEFRSELIQASRYRLGYGEHDSSSVASLWTPISGVERTLTDARLDSSLTDLSNSQAYRWATKLKNDLVNEDLWPFKFVQALAQLFRGQAFFYTLQPDTLGGEWVDQFLFATKRGFCAHYAGSTAYLLRSAGIPARVVIGYQGGERVPQQNYLIVRQSDAHAWVEFQVSNQWYRIDPTAWVAPDRVLANLSQALPEYERGLLRKDWFSGLGLTWLALQADLLNYHWHKWVVNYGESDRQGLFKNWLGGFSETKALIFLGLGVGIASLVFIMLMLGNRSTRNRSFTLRIYFLWVWFLGKFGYPRSPSEGPRSYLARLTKTAPKFIIKPTQCLTAAVEDAEFKS